MFAISVTPVRVYNSVEKKPEAAPQYKRNRHWRQHSMSPRMPVSDYKDVKIHELERQIDIYEAENKKLKLIAGWNLRAVQSALKNCQDMMDILHK